MHVEPVTLPGKAIRLEPLGMEHAQDLWEVADPGIFEYATLKPEEWSPEGFEIYMRRTLDMPDRFPFAIVLLETGKAIGTSSYFDIRPAHRGLEVGYTWIGAQYQGTKVNPEAKYLMLRHAFEELGAIRVQLKTDSRNLHSQRAMRKLGARREGTLRNHMLLPDGHIRHTVMFSITDEDWPQVKAGLEARLSDV